MFKLALQEEFLDIKRELLASKLYILWGIVFLMIAFVFFVSPEDFNWGFWIFYAIVIFSKGANYGQGNLFPKIFSYVPVTRKEKQRYIFLRAGLFSAVFFGTLAVGIVIAYNMGWISFHILLYWIVGGTLFLLVRSREKYYTIHKNLCGTYAYFGMGSYQRMLFWMFRILDIVVVCVWVIAAYVEKEDIGMMGTSIFLSLSVYEAASLFHNLSYVRTSMRRLEL